MSPLKKPQISQITQIFLSGNLKISVSSVAFSVKSENRFAKIYQAIGLQATSWATWRIWPER